MSVFSRWNTSRVTYKKNIFLFLSLVLNLLVLEKIGGSKGKEENPFFNFDLRVTNLESRLSFDFFLLYFFLSPGF